MCQTNTITRSVVRLSRRSFNHRMDVAGSQGYHTSQLARLNHDLNGLYELLYSEWRTVTEEDYRVFGGQFVIMLQTLKQLYDACRKLPKSMGLKDETEKLGMNYSALYELNSDIVNFSIRAPRNIALQTMMAKAAQTLNR